MSTTTQVREWVERCRRGDKIARDELLVHTRSRLVAIFRKCRNSKFVVIADELETDEFVNDLYVRLLERWERFDVPVRTASELDPAREYFGFASLTIRDILCDAIRKRFGRGKRPRAQTGSLEELAGRNDDSSARFDPSESTNDPVRNVIWAEIHEYFGSLPDPLRQVVELHYYHGLTHSEVSELLGIAEVTSRSRWTQVRHALKQRFDLTPVDFWE
jgi:RNA polymerase sigma factor (sigma-70 family)